MHHAFLHAAAAPAQAEACNLRRDTMERDSAPFLIRNGEVDVGCERGMFRAEIEEEKALAEVAGICVPVPTQVPRPSAMRAQCCVAPFAFGGALFDDSKTDHTGRRQRAAPQGSAEPH